MLFLLFCIIIRFSRLYKRCTSFSFLANCYYCLFAFCTVGGCALGSALPGPLPKGLQLGRVMLTSLRSAYRYPTLGHKLTADSTRRQF